MSTMTFQRCTNKSMGDVMRAESQSQNVDDEEEEDTKVVVFGASDEIGSTQRQVCGAAVAGGMAGACMGGIVGAMAGAAGAAYAAAKRECEVGEAARTVGDGVCEKSEKFLGEERVDKTVEGASEKASKLRDSMARSAQQTSFRASQSAKGIGESFSRTKERCSVRAVQIKEGASKVKEGASTKIKEGAVQIKEGASKAKEGASTKIKEGASKVKERASEGVTKVKVKTAEKAAKAKERVGSVKDKMRHSIRRVVRRKGTNGEDETEFHECLEDDILLLDEDGEFEDALDSVVEENEGTAPTETNLA